MTLAFAGFFLLSGSWPADPREKSSLYQKAALEKSFFHDIV